MPAFIVNFYVGYVGYVGKVFALNTTPGICLKLVMLLHVFYVICKEKILLQERSFFFHFSCKTQYLQTLPFKSLIYCLLTEKNRS